MKSPQFVQLHHDDQASVRHELLRGLTANPGPGGAFTAPKFLYDALGSKLFEAITELPEYYPTRTEAAIFAAHGAAMAHHVPKGATLIDLGAGNCNKAASLFDRFAPSRYVAVDISVEFLRSALACLQRQYPDLDMVGVGLDFSQTLALPPEAGAADAGSRLLFYPGSSIGNFTPEDALAFLRQGHAACGPGTRSGLLIGVDLVKNASELEAAYDDALGVTAAFNRNMLLHINRLAGCDFALADWAHVARYDETLCRIEMHVQATRDVTVRWAGGSRSFVAGERIHTESSYKWTVAGFTALLREAGFRDQVVWTDAPEGGQSSAVGRFAVVWAGV
jgi:L-histidine Nalpha-methyltransferase